MKRTLKLFILGTLIRRCEWKIIKMDIRIKKFNDKIVKAILKGEDELRIEKMKFDREKLWSDRRRVFDWKYKFEIAKIRAI
jgi:hypothetical protein